MKKLKKTGILVSGLLLLCALILQSCNTDDSINLTPVEFAVLEGKKGLGVTAISTNNWRTKVENTNVAWHYSWGNKLPEAEPAGVEFIPMIWGGNNPDKFLEKIANVEVLKADGTANYLLGFNEPDGKDQSNMTVDTAIERWPQMEALALPLGSPATVSVTNEWMQTFMHKADSLNYRIDFVAMHWYGSNGPGDGGNPENLDPAIVRNHVTKLISIVKEAYKMYGRPIWITEFAPAHWGTNTPSESKFSKEYCLEFMKQALHRLDAMEFVHKYAWFSASIDSGHLGNAALYDYEGNLTVLGEYYMSH